jgi:hypothetical protein
VSLRSTPVRVSSIVGDVERPVSRYRVGLCNKQRRSEHFDSRQLSWCLRVGRTTQEGGVVEQRMLGKCASRKSKHAQQLRIRRVGYRQADKFFAPLIGRSFEAGAGQAVPKWLPPVPRPYLELLPQIATQLAANLLHRTQGRSLGFLPHIICLAGSRAVSTEFDQLASATDNIFGTAGRFRPAY